MFKPGMRVMVAADVRFGPNYNMSFVGAVGKIQDISWEHRHADWVHKNDHPIINVHLDSKDGEGEIIKGFWPWELEPIVAVETETPADPQNEEPKEVQNDTASEPEAESMRPA